MAKLPDDLMQYIRTNKLGRSQKEVIRRLARECEERKVTAAEYVGRYVRRIRRIADTLGGPRLTP